MSRKQAIVGAGLAWSVVCILLTAAAQAPRLRRDALTNHLRCLFFVLGENSYLHVIFHNSYSSVIPFPLSSVQSSGGSVFPTAFQWAIFYLPIGSLSPISQHWDMAQALLHFHGAECSSALSRAAYGDLSWGLTPLINSACRSTEPHIFDWLLAQAASLEASSDWPGLLLHYSRHGQHSDPKSFQSMLW